MELQFTKRKASEDWFNWSDFNIILILRQKDTARIPMLQALLFYIIKARINLCLIFVQNLARFGLFSAFVFRAVQFEFGPRLAKRLHEHRRVAGLRGRSCGPPIAARSIQSRTNLTCLHMRVCPCRSCKFLIQEGDSKRIKFQTEPAAER